MQNNNIDIKYANINVIEIFFLFTSKQNHAYKEDRLKWLSLLDVNYRCQEIISAINGVMPLIKYILPSELK